MPFGDERWNPSHKSNAGRRGAFLFRAASPDDPVHWRLFGVEQGEYRGGRFQPQIGRVDAALGER
jgi:hypothetical protein